MGLTFELTDEQVKVVRHWMEEHDCSIKETGRIPALGERVRFFFIPTMLGTIAVVQCVCGAEQYLTSWEDL